MATNQKVAVVIAMLCEAFNRTPTKATYKAYEIALSDISDESLTEAGNQVLRGSSAFMPTPGQLRQLCLTGGTTYAGRAEIAWREFDDTVGIIGGDKSVTFADGLINATVRLLGGWIQCCDRTGDNYFVWLQKSFKETYSRLCESGANEELRRPLGGRLAKANAIFPAEILEKVVAYTGLTVVKIGTSQPVIAPPTEPSKRITERPKDVPVIEFKKI